MKAGDDGYPDVGRTARTLGVRPGIDVPVDDAGQVEPGHGGVSVAPDSPAGLPAHRRPPGLGGTGKDPVWELELADLGGSLAYREDPAQPCIHGFIEPREEMPLDAYERALSATRLAWRSIDGHGNR
jgi:hypothetical protein